MLALSEALDCGVLLKGRHTVMVTRGSGTDIVTVDAGSSWAATPAPGTCSPAWSERGPPRRSPTRMPSGPGIPGSTMIRISPVAGLHLRGCHRPRARRVAGGTDPGRPGADVGLAHR
ncbi:hypothetical protein QP028_08070 [Corynebacterium suedekumii]|nr:hypothetical protein QP028_08070 [Corynebacterium suedekumii]